MTVAWKYAPKNLPTGGDTICAYLDGVLFKDHELTVTKPELSADDYSVLNVDQRSWYALSRITDKRPVAGGFDDVQPSLVAQFAFDKDASGNQTLVDGKVLSAVALSVDQTKRPSLAYKSGESIESSIVACEGGSGGKCIRGSPTGFKYDCYALESGVAFITWMQFNKAGQDEIVLATFQG